MTASVAIRQMRRVGIVVDVVGDTVLLSGATTHVRDAWWPTVRAMRREIVALLAPRVAAPAQVVLPGVRP